uniref:exodeoxyribonuclease III n=1 Tax=Sparus aurata TaxID=8175 RepID=A0A671W6Z6_SPAAU
MTQNGSNLNMNNSCNVMSWNVRGLNSPVKRTKCLEFLKRKEVSIALIQETHLKTNDVHRFQNRFYKLAILFSRKLGVKVEKSGNDGIGRLTYVCVTINNTKICLASVYGPNTHDPNFLRTISNSLLDFPGHQLIVGGDFNQVCDKNLDKSVNAISTPDSPRGINTFISELNVIDPWRLRNPLVQNYTFFSARHKTYSRIDYILTSASLNHCINSTDILPIVISDHAPVLYNFKFLPTHSKGTRRWRFNTTLLQNADFLKKLRNNLKILLEINLETAASPQILWETTKCFIRGEALSFASYLKAARRHRVTQLEDEIRTLESDLKQQFSEQNHSTLSALKFELNNLLKDKAEFIIHRTRLTYYDQSERSSKLLAARLKQNESFSTISAIQTSAGPVTYDQGEINNTF